MGKGSGHPLSLALFCLNLASILLISIIWPISTGQQFGFESDDQLLPLHPLSPPERPQILALARAKRQAYQVYLGTDVSVSMDQGAGDSGPWGEWGQQRECCEFCGADFNIKYPFIVLNFVV
jgi:hypothetical protein